MTNATVILDGTPAEPASLGGKGCALNLLIGMGAPVPATGSITTDGYRWFVRDSGLQRFIDDLRTEGLLDQSDLDRAAERVDSAFLEAAMPDALAREIRDLAVAVGGGELLAVRFDQPVSDWVRGGGEQLLLTKVVTQFGSPNLAIAVGLVGVALMWRRCRASAVTLAILVTAALTTDIVLKLVVDRTRPPSPAVDTALGSFPSGHVIHAVVIFGLVPFLLWALTNRRVFLRLGFALFVVVVGSVAVSRVRLGAHWPSDVIASFFIGASLLLAAEQILTSMWATDRCASLGHHPTDPVR